MEIDKDYLLKEKIERVYDMFERSFIYGKNELILHKKWNIYFRLDNASVTENTRSITPDEFDYKMLSYLSYYCASNHFRKLSKQCKWAWNRLNRWFKKEFTYEELQKIYCKFGCGANMSLGLEFIKSNFDFSII